MVANLNMDWKSSCLEILNYVSDVIDILIGLSHKFVLQFSERTPGSYVEEREASVVWRFWTGESNDECSDRHWARRQAAEAQNHIFDRYVSRQRA